MKTLKQIKEDYDSNFLPQAIPEEIMLEDKSYTSGASAPSPTKMPAMLLFRRVSYKMFPGRNYVALYYSKMLDKYLSIPFGPEGNLNLSEATVYDTLEELELSEGAKWQAVKGGVKGAAQGALKGLFKGNAVAAEPGMAIGAVVGGVHGAYKGAKNAYNKAKEKDMNEDWQKVNRKDKTDGLSQAAVNAYRRENPGSKLKTAVTEKNPSGKRAARRKSFCSRMGGMKKRLTSAKTARDPDSNINKALRRWNCEESFRQKLYEKRMQNEGVKDYLDAGAEAIVPYYSAGKKLYKGDYKGAATDAAIDTAMLATGAIAGKALGAGARLLGKGVSKLTGRGAKAAKAAKPRKAPPTTAPKKSTKIFGLPDLPTSGSSDKGSYEVSDGKRVELNKPTIHQKSSWEQRPSSDPVYKSKLKTQSLAPVKENKISDLRDMINEGNNLHEMNINGRTVTLNNSMAKRIIEVYDSVNTKNKKIVESMLNEDLESFKKLLNFSIRN